MKEFSGKIINMTPHEINLNSGESFPVSGKIARVKVTLKEYRIGFYTQEFGAVEGLPEDERDDIFYIVSGLVFGSTERKDVIAPASSHQDTIRNEKGHIVSVPGFTIKR